MVLPPELEPIFDALKADPAVHVGKALKSPGLMVAGKLFAFLMNDHLVLKLPAPEVDALITTLGAHRLSRAGKAIKEWVCLSADHRALWPEHVTRAKQFVAGG